MAAVPARRAPARTPTRTRPARPAPARRTAPARRGTTVRPSTTARIKPHPRGAAILDRLLQGRGWIALIFLLLVGIVFFNVDLLRMNRDIAATAERAGEIKRSNSRLRTELAKLGSSERIQRVAADAGLVMPAPGEVRYLDATPAVDARRAAKRIDKGEVAAPAVEPVAPVPAEPVATAPVAPEPVVPAPAGTVE